MYLRLSCVSHMLGTRGSTKEDLASVPSKDLVGKERTNYTIYGVLEKIHSFPMDRKSVRYWVHQSAHTAYTCLGKDAS